MATKKTTANTTAQTLVSTPAHKKAVVKSLQIDNQSAAVRTVRLQDIFTPDASNGVSSPTEQTIERVYVSVPATTLRVLTEEELVGVECLGTIKAIADAIAATCAITVGYDFK
ncbi:MAG: hypothetical protein M8353_03250 [ANME-2 cluster archaeon]|nr:hypothetical protein [ANME-2 cluster archaeon]